MSVLIMTYGRWGSEPYAFVHDLETAIRKARKASELDPDNEYVIELGEPGGDDTINFKAGRQRGGTSGDPRRRRARSRDATSSRGRVVSRGTLAATGRGEPRPYQAIWYPDKQEVVLWVTRFGKTRPWGRYKLSEYGGDMKELMRILRTDIRYEQLPSDVRVSNRRERGAMLRERGLRDRSRRRRSRSRRSS